MASTGRGAILNCAPAYIQTTEQGGTGGPHRIQYLSARSNSGPEYVFGLQKNGEISGYKTNLELKNCNFSMNECTSGQGYHKGIIYISSFWSDIFQCTFAHNSYANGILYLYGFPQDDTQTCGQVHSCNFVNNYDEYITLMYVQDCEGTFRIYDCSYIDNTCWGNYICWAVSSYIEVSNIYTNKDFTTGNSGVSYSDIHRQDSINLPQLTHYGTRVCNASYPYPLRSATPKPTITLQETPFKTPTNLHTQPMRLLLYRKSMKYLRF